MCSSARYLLARTCQSKSVSSCHPTPKRKKIKLALLPRLITSLNKDIILGPKTFTSVSLDPHLVVDEGDFLDPQPLFLIELLLLLEDPLVEELLQLLVAVVDAELLEAVDGEVLEPGDVQDADVVGRPLKGNALQVRVKMNHVEQ